MNPQSFLKDFNQKPTVFGVLGPFENNQQPQPTGVRCVEVKTLPFMA